MMFTHLKLNKLNYKLSMKSLATMCLFHMQAKRAILFRRKPVNKIQEVGTNTKNKDQFSYSTYFNISNKISHISYRLPIIIWDQKVLLTRNKRLISSITESIFLWDIVADEISDLEALIHNPHEKTTKNNKSEERSDKVKFY